MFKKLLLCITILMSYNSITQTGLIDRIQNITFPTKFIKRFGASATSGLLTTGLLFQQEGSLNKEILTAGLISALATELIYPPLAVQTLTQSEDKEMGIFSNIFNCKAAATIVLGIGAGYGYFNYYANR